MPLIHILLRMSVFLYNCAIYLMQWGLKLVAPFNQKARLMVSGRKNWRQKLKKSITNHEGPIIWFHCASLGEFEQGRPIIEAVKQKHPRFKILLTFFSPSGYEVRKNYPQADVVAYLPLDTPKNAADFISMVQPMYVLIIKYEYWYHLLKQAHDVGARLVLCSAIFRPQQIFFKPYGGLHRKILKNFEQLFVQDQASEELLSTIDINKVTVSGDTRIDRVSHLKTSASRDALVDQFILGSPLTVVVGSSWPADIEVLKEVVHHTDWKFIIAPHEIKHARQIEKTLKMPVSYYTEQNLETTNRVMVVDTIGKLAHLYQYADLAYIGGAFGQGLHNILEAATFGVPLFFGNRNFRKFAEAVNLIALGAAWAVEDGLQLHQAMLRVAQNPEVKAMAQENSENYVQQHVGATDTILNYLQLNP